MTISVRPARPEEDRVIEGHVHESRMESRRHRGRLDPTPAEGAHHIVGVIGDEVVGSLSWSDQDGRRDIIHLYVVPECRGVGVGDALMERVLSDARNSGMVAVTSTVLPGDRETKNMMERHGLVARAIQVERSLD